MRRQTLYRCMLVLFAVILLLQGWGIVMDAKEDKREFTIIEDGTIKTDDIWMRRHMRL